jgi:hypothetical protein
MLKRCSLGVGGRGASSSRPATTPVPSTRVAGVTAAPRQLASSGRAASVRCRAQPAPTNEEVRPAQAPAAMPLPITAETAADSQAFVVRVQEFKGLDPEDDAEVGLRRNQSSRPAAPQPEAGISGWPAQGPAGPAACPALRAKFLSWVGLDCAQVPGGYSEAMDTTTKLGKAVRSAVNELNHLNALVRKIACTWSSLHRH